MIVALALAVAIGFTLALLGSGGSIITLPVLVYGAGVPPDQAVGMSLAIVGGTSLAATVMNARRGLVHAKAASLFGLAGIVGALGGAQLTPMVSAPVLMLLFAALMVVVAVFMLRGRPDLASDAAQCQWRVCTGTGAVVGGLTGFLGVGGGFVIVPAMVLFGRLPLKQAIATSLVVIAVNSFAGLAAHVRQAPFDWRLTAMFLAIALAGMTAGRFFAGRVAVEHLRGAFAWFVLAVAAFVIWQNRAVFS